MEIRHLIDGVILLRPATALDAASVVSAGATIDYAVAAPDSRVVVDLTNVEFMDSSGASYLLHLHHRLLASARSLTLTGSKGQPRRLIELLRIDRLVQVKDTLADALRPAA